jgi:sugar phosphate isomerase/epimerase
MKLGLVTYNVAKEWDIPTIIKRCSATGFEGVELRSTHAHGVELDLSANERREVRKAFADSPVKLAQLGSAFEYHSTGKGVVRKNIEGTKKYAQLAADVGAPGIKVRPNGLETKKGVPVETTLKQIGEALHECADFAQPLGVEIRVEVHGQGTSEPPNMRQIMLNAHHPNCYVNWNSNSAEVEGGSIRKNFDLVKDWISHVHMRDLSDRTYPWVELFRLLKSIEYRGYCCAEIQESPDPIRLMGYYSALWDAYNDLAAK